MFYNNSSILLPTGLSGLISTPSGIELSTVASGCSLFELVDLSAISSLLFSAALSNSLSARFNTSS